MTRRCAWCPRKPESIRLRPHASHGICRPCLAAGLRADGAWSGARFLVWDADARAGAAWARELAAMEVGRG